MIVTVRFSVRVTIWSWWRAATDPPLTETPARVTQRTTEIKTESQNGTELLSLMNRFIFYKQIFKLIATQTARTWRGLLTFLV